MYTGRRQDFQKGEGMRSGLNFFHADSYSFKRSIDTDSLGMRL